MLACVPEEPLRAVTEPALELAGTAEAPASSPFSARAKLAPWSDVKLWFALSALISAVMLLGVIVFSHFVPADASAGSGSLLLRRRNSWHTAAWIFRRNMLVLTIHFLACAVGGIIGRPHQPLPESWSRFRRLDRELPPWLARGALLYALCATLTSVALQTTGNSFVLADLAAYLRIDSAWVIFLVLPHAIPELVGVFLPLALFLVNARRGQLAVLSVWAWQSAVIGLPLVAGAALIEAFVTPQWIHWMGA